MQKRKLARASSFCLLESVFPKKSFAPLPLEGADERSEAGLASVNVGVPLHAANLRPSFSLLPKEGGKKRGAFVLLTKAPERR